MPLSTPDTLLGSARDPITGRPTGPAAPTLGNAPITTTFAPPSLTVVSGADAVFTETISVAANAPGGTYTCRDRAQINGEDLKDDVGAVIYEVKTIKVPEGFLTGGGQINNGKGKTPEKISFGGNVGFLADFSLVGNWNVVLHNVADTANDGGHFKGTDPTALQFSVVCGPAANPPPANANFAHFTFSGSYNGVGGNSLLGRREDVHGIGRVSRVFRQGGLASSPNFASGIVGFGF